MEIWDIYDQYRQKTTRTHIRGEGLPKNDYHLVVHVWIINDEGQYLIQQRQPWKIGFGGMWDCSAAGSAITGDTSIMAAYREVKEELGIDLDLEQAEPLFSIRFPKGFDDIWLVRQNINLADLTLQFEEVKDAKWVSMEEIKEMIDDQLFIPYPYLDIMTQLINSDISLKSSIQTNFKGINQDQLDPRSDECFSIMIKKHVIGTIMLEYLDRGRMELKYIAIDQTYQRQGIGQSIMGRLEIMYPQIGCWVVELVKTQKELRVFFEKNGYIQSDITERDSYIHFIKNEKLNLVEP